MVAQTFPTSRKFSIWLALGGVVLGTIGLLAVFHPLATDLATAFVLALCFLVAGMGSLLTTFSGDDRHHRLISLFFGSMAIATGVLLAAFPLDGAVSLAWLIGAFFAATGVVEIVSAMRTLVDRVVHAVLGAVDLGLGLLVLVQMPAGALDMLAVLVGASFIVRAAALLALAFVLREPFRPA